MIITFRVTKIKNYKIKNESLKIKKLKNGICIIFPKDKMKLTLHSLVVMVHSLYKTISNESNNPRWVK